MTSGDTHERTVKLLQDNDNFGMAEGQVTLVKQEKVPALIDAEARFALSADDPFTVETKPHGHGDVHTLLTDENGEGVVAALKQYHSENYCAGRERMATRSWLLADSVGIN